MCNKYDIQVHFKGGRTMTSLLISPKDSDTIAQKVGLGIGTNVTE